MFVTRGVMEAQLQQGPQRRPTLEEFEAEPKANAEGTDLVQPLPVTPEPAALRPTEATSRIDDPLMHQPSSRCIEPSAANSRSSYCHWAASP